MANAGDTTPEQRLERLRGLLAGTRSDSRTAQVLARADKANVLIGAALHGADRLRQGHPATDLEQMVLAVMRAALSEQEIKDWGRVYRQAVDTMGKPALVPEAIAVRPVTQGYSFADLAAGIAPVAQEHMARSNTALIDREALAAGGSIDTPQFIEGMREWGSGVTAFASPGRAGVAGQEAQDAETAQEAGEAGERTAPPSFRVKVELENFYVHRAVGDQGGGRDEIYWCSSAGSDKVAGRGYRSQEFGAVKKGQTRSFDTAKRTVFDGQSSQGVVFHIQCWEADQSSSAWYEGLDKALNDLSQRIFTTWWWSLATGVLPGTDLVGYMGELINLFALLMHQLRNEDDLSCQRMIALDQHDLAVLAHRGQDSWHFNGDGYHELRVKYSGDKVPFPTGTLEYVFRENGAWSTPIALPFESMTPPALASYNGHLYALFVRAADQAVMWTRQEGAQWRIPQRVGGDASYYAPAVGVAHGWLYYAVTGTNKALYWRGFNGSDWTAVQKFDGYESATAPSLSPADPAGMLYMSHIGAGKGVPFHNIHDGQHGWSGPWQDTTWLSSSRPVALFPFGGKMNRFARDGNGKMNHSTTTTGSPWTSHGTISNWAPTHGPACAAQDNNMWVFQRGSDARLWVAHTPAPDASFSPASVIGAAHGLTLMDEPAATTHNGRMYVMYRR